MPVAGPPPTARSSITWTATSNSENLHDPLAEAVVPIRGLGCNWRHWSLEHRPFDLGEARAGPPERAARSPIFSTGTPSSTLQFLVRAVAVIALHGMRLSESGAP